jgi:hypothetical protein
MLWVYLRRSVLGWLRFSALIYFLAAMEPLGNAKGLLLGPDGGRMGRQVTCGRDQGLAAGFCPRPARILLYG